MGVRLGVRTAHNGAVFGAAIGGLMWGSWVLALASITPAHYTVLASWFVGQTLEMSLAGAVTGAAFARDRLRAVTVFVLVLVISCFVVTVLLQNTGLAPAEHVGP